MGAARARASTPVAVDRVRNRGVSKHPPPTPPPVSLTASPPFLSLTHLKSTNKQHEHWRMLETRRPLAPWRCCVAPQWRRPPRTIVPISQPDAVSTSATHTIDLADQGWSKLQHTADATWSHEPRPRRGTDVHFSRRNNTRTRPQVGHKRTTVRRDRLYKKQWSYR